MSNMAEKLGFDPTPMTLGRLPRRSKQNRIVGACKGCSNCQQIYEVWGSLVCSCRLTNTVLLPLGCSLRDKDISREKICCNCKHYLGGCDWGLSCAKEYHRLVDPLDEACSDFEDRPL